MYETVLVLGCPAYINGFSITCQCNDGSTRKNKYYILLIIFLNILINNWNYNFNIFH